MKRADARRDGMVARRGDQMFLTKLHGRIWDASLTFQTIEPAHHLLIQPWPLLKIQDAVMQYDNAFAAFHKIAQVLFPLVVQVAGEIVENQYIVLGPDVLLEGQRAVGDRHPTKVFIA